MSMRPCGLALCLLLAATGTARAQFAGGLAPEGESESGAAPSEPSTDLDLRLTLSTFGYSEFGDQAEGLVDGTDALQVASPYRRLFSDLRMELGAEHIAGSAVETHMDARVRHVNRGDVQSGFRGSDELDLRELKVSYGRQKHRFTLGRQRILSVDASKIDGISYTLDRKGPWSMVFMGGTYPTRGSRSIDTDYPKSELVDGQEGGKRVIPAIVGTGASYTRPSLHGDIGAGAILPLRAYGPDDVRDKPQIFVHSNGFWRASSHTTLYHYATADLASPTGSAVRNASLAVSSQAATHLLLHASLHHQSTELLRESVVNQLEDPDTESMGLVQNGLSLARVASQSARAAISVDALSRRLQFTLQAGLRQRPEVQLELADGTQYEITTSRSSELTLLMLDRRFPLGLRLAGQLTALQGFAKSDLATSSGIIGSVEVTRELWSGRAQLSLDAAGQSLKDSDRLGDCDPNDPVTCYGRSSVSAAQLGLQAMVQSSQNWLVLFDAHWGLEKVESHDAMGQPVELPVVQSLTAFARLQYRFH